MNMQPDRRDCLILRVPKIPNRCPALSNCIGMAEVATARSSGLGAVANLVWRGNGGIEVNAARYLARETDLDAMDFANFAIRDRAAERERPPKSPTRLTVPNALAWRLSRALSPHARVTVHPLAVGRNCVANYSWCGGGAIPHRGGGPEDFARRALAAKCRHFRGQRSIRATASAVWAAADALRPSRCGDEAT